MRQLLNIWMISLLFVSVVAANTATPRAAIVFDASGSMWGRIDGKAKITIAKEALSDVIKHWNADIPLGLTIYGHRRKADCNDIETVIPPGPLDKKKMLSIIGATKPKGKTPIVRSLRKVADELDYTKHKAIIILISDGRETCDHDPLKAIEALKKKGLDLVVHVIGFDVDKETSKQLQSIAEITGGEYLPAKDAASLGKAFTSIAKKVKATKPPAAPKHNLLVSASETEGGAWVQALHEIYRVDENLSMHPAGSCISYRDTPCRIKVEAGNYMLHSSYNRYEKETPVETCEYNVTKVHVVMGETGKVSITAREAKDSPRIVLHFSIYSGPDLKLILSDHTLTDRGLVEKLPIGDYTLRYTYHTYHNAFPFRVEAGKKRAIDILAGKTGKIALSASELKGGKWVSASYDLYRLDEHGARERNATDSCYSTESEACHLQLPAGSYLVSTRYRDLERETTVEIPYRKELVTHIVLKPTGTLEIVARESERGDAVSASYEIFGSGHDSVGKSRVVTAGKTDPRKAVALKLFAGKYDIEAEYCGYDRNFTAEVKADRVSHLQLVMGRTGRVEITAVLHKEGQPVEPHYTVYRDTNGTVDLISVPCSAHKDGKYLLRLPVGDYRVKAEYAPFEQIRRFHIDAGERRKIVFVLNPSGKVKISASEAVGGKGVRAVHNVYRVVNGEVNTSKIFDMCISDKNSSCELKLPVGKYLLDTTYNHFEKKTPFTIEEDRTLPLNVVMDLTGVVKISAYATEHGKAVDATYYIYAMEGNRSRDISITDCWRRTECIRRLPVGRYLVDAEYNLLKKKKEFEIKGGETTEVSLVIGMVGKAILYTTILPSQHKVSANHEFYRIKDNGTRKELAVICWYDDKIGGCPITLPAGKYLVRTSYKEHSKETYFTIEGDDVREVDIPIETGDEHDRTKSE